MYAVIQTGGKQYRVAEGDTLKVEKISADEGASVELDKVLMVADGEDVKVGKPYRRRRQGHGDGQDPWPRQEGQDHQVPSAQAVPEASGPPSVVHRA